MKVNWRQLLKTVKGIGQAFIPAYISDLIDTVEDQVEDLLATGAPKWSSAEKQRQVLETFLNGLLVYEGLKGADVLNNEVIRAAGVSLIDAAHAQKVATATIIAEVKRLKDQAKAAPDVTGPAV